MSPMGFSSGAWPLYAAALAIGYGLGSIPFGWIIAQLIGAGDVRKIGSGATGATNVLRTGNKPAAAATFLLDFAKGAVAVLLMRLCWGAIPGEAMTLPAAAGAILGHLFPVWLGFRGGKGVATFFGIMIALVWPAGLIGGAIWIALAFVVRISSVSSLAATAITPLLMLGFGHRADAVLAALLAILIWAMHRANIGRLLAGTEPRIGGKTR